ncbi:MAG TPA: L-seryl-tRNA(Sec) selenium transferase [Candidatus Eisenbacteria bacterium]|nr:L-seryl-tRNA(Sec) selenium transferase [Candidatus Eisenbacteria bacterium]
MVKTAPGELRELPSVDRLLKHPRCEPLLARYKRDYVTDTCRAVLERVRSRIRQARETERDELTEDAILRRVEAAIAEESEPALVRVVNATGTILHTNLGRALLSEAAIEAVCAVAGRPVNLEYDLGAGTRGRREDTIARLLVRLTGGEAATVVNNNAAAVLLALNTLAEGREVLVSRGELIEIGGSFRIPEIMAKSGAILKEVGSTNRTHPEDYERAITERTALLLKVHTSNYKIVGFTTEVGLETLARIGKARNIPVMEDLGSGALIDLAQLGLPAEPIAGESLRAGADVVTFSGDKVLGGPQAGLIVGKRSFLERMSKNHLHRALRCGKLTLAALEATLRSYLQSADIAREIPTLRLFTRPLAEIRAMGEAIVPMLRDRLGARYRVDLEDSNCQIGSGALPTEELPSVAIAITATDVSPTRIAERFRRAVPPIIGRIRDNRFLLDLRTIFDPNDLIPNFERAERS